MTLVSSNSSKAAIKWLGFENLNVIAWFKLENRVEGGPLKLMERLPDNPFLEGSYLEFASRATFLSIVPGPEVKGDLSVSVGTSILHKYHILDGQDWIGTILVSPECAACYPMTIHQYEFIELSRFSVYLHQMNNYVFGNFFDMLNRSKEPSIFDEKYYQIAKGKIEYESFERLHGQSKPGPFGDGGPTEEHDDSMSSEPLQAKIWISHVMWIERKESIAYRIVIRVIHQSPLKWHEMKICLG